jgi:hypothetical protein
MTHVMKPFHLLVIALAGWRNRHQQAVTGCFIQESRFLKDQFEGQWCAWLITGHAAIKVSSSS